MKRKLLVLVGLLALTAAPAFCEWRFDIGVDAIFGFGALSDQDADTLDFPEMTFLTLPMGEAGYEWDLGPVSLGAGVRGITLILVNLLWPDIFATLELGPAAIEAHLGGLAFLAVGLINDGTTGQVFIPELSAWFKLGKAFRLGGGAIGFYHPDMEGNILFLYYLGAKWVLHA